MTASKTTSRRGTARSAPASAATVEATLRTERRQLADTVEVLTERLREAVRGPAAAERLAEAGVMDLERQITGDPGWRRFAVLTEAEFSADGMVQIRGVCRLMSIANPLIKRGLSLRTHYVWGQGCTVTARADGKTKDGEQDVAAVIAGHIDDAANQRAFWGQQAREENERALGTDGEVFVALFTKPQSGWVQTRTISADEISEVITNPEDSSEPWFYRRVWARAQHTSDGRQEPEPPREVLYPDVDYRPAGRQRPARWGGIEILWDAPVVHVHVNRPKGWLRGIPDTYSVINWARAYKEFLERWSALMASLSKFAWRLTAEGRNKEQAKRAIAAAGTSRNLAGGVNDVGGTAIGPPGGGQLEAIPKSGATIDSESGRPLAAMVAAGLDLPITMLLGDPGTTGARATAETLDWPTELAMMARREVWTAAQIRIVRYVIAESVRAGKGLLKGTVKIDPVSGREVLTLAGDTDTTVDVDWPDLDEVDVKAVIESVVAANATGTLRPELVLQLVLQALGVRDIDSILEEMVDDQGKFLWPETPQNAAGGPGQQAADLARTGADPATAGPGSMGPDGEPMPEPDLGDPTDPGQQDAATAAIADGITADAAARQADADFGLFGGSGAGQDDENPDPGAPPGASPPDQGDPLTDQDTGDEPAGELYDPEFFTL